MIAIMSKPFAHYLEELPGRLLQFRAAEMVLHNGAPVESLFVVRHGLVHLQRFQADGGAVILQRAAAGEILAEASVFSGEYHCGAVVIVDAELCAYPLPKVRALLATDTKAMRAYARHLADEVREARKRAEILALKTVKARLEAWLTWNNGFLPARGAWHHVADEIGISKEALYRELSMRRKQEGKNRCA